MERCSVYWNADDADTSYRGLTLISLISLIRDYPRCLHPRYPRSVFHCSIYWNADDADTSYRGFTRIFYFFLINTLAYIAFGLPSIIITPRAFKIIGINIVCFGVLLYFIWVIIPLCNSQNLKLLRAIFIQKGNRYSH